MGIECRNDDREGKQRGLLKFKSFLNYHFFVIKRLFAYFCHFINEILTNSPYIVCIDPPQLAPLGNEWCFFYCG